MDPFLPVAEPDLSERERAYARQAIDSGWISSIGEFIPRFEAAFAKVAGAKHCIAVANGTVALHVSLAALEVGPGDEVIVPDLTFAATAAAVRHVGATPVLVDVDARTGCLDPELVAQAITPQTKVVLAVHLLGHPAPMAELAKVCERHGVALLEDAAEAHGARTGGRVVGALGRAGCFSFYGNKLITTGEGGAVTTNDDALAARIRFLKDHAMDPERRYFHTAVGFNFRMTNVQAAIGLAQVERFPEILAARAERLGWYREALAGTGIELNPAVGDAEPVCWLVAARLPGAPRDGAVTRIMAAMKRDHAVDARPFFVPMHVLPPYAAHRRVLRSPACSLDLAARGICLPSSSRLTQADVRRAAAALVVAHNSAQKGER